MRIAWDKTRDSAIGYSEKDIRLQRCANSSARDTLLSYLSFKFSLLAPDRMLTKVCHYTAFRRLWVWNHGNTLHLNVDLSFRNSPLRSGSTTWPGNCC